MKKPNSTSSHFGTLASILANESIEIVYNQDADTAMADLKNKKIILPTKMALDEEVQLGLIVHEVGHFNYSNSISMAEVSRRSKSFSATNIIEDIRVDSKMRKQFKGVDKIQAQCYSKLKGRGYITIKIGEEKSIFEKFVTRNLLRHFEEFSPEDEAFYERALNATSIEESISIANEMVDKYLEAKDPGQDNEKEGDKDPNASDNDQDLNESSATNETSKNSKNKAGKKEKGGGIDSPLDDAFGNSENKEPCRGKETNGDALSELENICDLHKALQTANKNGKYISQRTIFNTVFEPYVGQINLAVYGNAVQVDNVVIQKGVKRFNQIMNTRNRAPVRHKIVGDIDVSKIASYKTSDNLFIRKGIKEKQMNHSVVVLIDTSGSIDSIKRSYFTNLINFITLIEKIGMPVEVFTYTTADFSGGVKLVQLYGGESSIKNIKGLSVLLSGQFMKGLGVREFRLGGTPTAEALISLRNKVDEFRKRSNTEKTKLILFTDGEYSVSQEGIQDPIFGNVDINVDAHIIKTYKDLYQTDIAVFNVRNSVAKFESDPSKISYSFFGPKHCPQCEVPARVLSASELMQFIEFAGQTLA